MQADVRSFIAVDMHRHFRARLQFLARGRLVALHLSPDDVIGVARGHALRELAGMIGIKLPTRFLLVSPSDLDLDRIERAPVRTPNRSEDKRIRPRLRILAPGRRGN